MSNISWLTATFNGTALPIRITSIERNLCAPISNTTHSVGNANGVDFDYSVHQESYIEIGYMINLKGAAKLADFRRTMGGILNAEEPGELIISDEPQLYYRAIPDGEQTFAESYPFSTGKIKFLVPDGLAYSAAEKTFSAAPNDSGTLEAAIVNEGTAGALISYSITHTAENGFIGIVSEYGAIQLGSADEVDGEDYEQNEILATSSDKLVWDGSAWYNDQSANAQNPDNQTDGYFAQRSLNGGNWLELFTCGEKAGVWNGAMMSIDIVDSNGEKGAENVYVWAKSWFQASSVSETGAQIVSFVDADGNEICSQVLVKSGTSSGTANARFYVGGNNHRRAYSYSFKATSSAYADNPYSSGHGSNDMRKEGSRITFYYAGDYPSIDVPELADVKVAKVQIYLAQYGARDLTSEYMNRNYFGRVMVQLLHVSKWRDVPNRYQPGDEIYIDGESRKVYVNDMPKAEDEAVGSSYFDAPPGETKVEFYCSDFCKEAPEITLTIRERYL